MVIGIFAMFKIFKLLHDDRIYCMLNVLDFVLITVLWFYFNQLKPLVCSKCVLTVFSDEAESISRDDDKINGFCRVCNTIGFN